MNENKNYCLRCKKKCDIKDVEIKTTKNNRRMMSGKCIICETKTNRFLKKDDVKEIIESHIINKKPVERLLLKQ